MDSFFLFVCLTLVDSCPIIIMYERIYFLTNLFSFLCHCSRYVSYKSLMFGSPWDSLLLFIIVFDMKMDIVGLISFILVYAICLGFLCLLAFFSSYLWPNVLYACSFYPSDLKVVNSVFNGLMVTLIFQKNSRSYALLSLSGMLQALLTLSMESERPSTLAYLSHLCPPPTSQDFFGITLAFKSKLMILFNYQSFSFHNYFYICLVSLQN